MRFFFTVELYNSQVVLKGVETDGHVIVSAAKAEIMSYEYQPVWQNQQVHSKTSWVSSIDCMQVCSIFIYQVAGDGRMSRVGSSDCLPKFVLKEREFWQELLYSVFNDQHFWFTFIKYTCVKVFPQSV